MLEASQLVGMRFRHVIDAFELVAVTEIVVEAAELVVMQWRCCVLGASELVAVTEILCGHRSKEAFEVQGKIEMMMLMIVLSLELCGESDGACECSLELFSTASHIFEHMCLA